MDAFCDVLGPIYQASVPVAERRHRGQYYTPEWLADVVLDAAGYDGHGTLVDPACGSGVFLLRALARRMRQPERPPQAGGPPHLVGFDNDPVAVEAARVQLGGSAR